jgi:DNA-binding winged helix-turn-helix (wHTH) protein/tetratricopeptide (TPR) repeat protein
MTMGNEENDVRVADWWANLSSRELRRGGERLRLEPKVARVLQLLLERAGEVVTREDLLERVWPGVVVCEDAVTNTVIKLRKALGDSAREPKIIETVPKAGYRLCASAVGRKIRGCEESAASLSAGWDSVLGSTRRLLIRSEPLTPVGFPGSASLEAQIVAELHRCPWLHVVPTPSAPAHFALQGMYIEGATGHFLLLRVVDASIGAIAWSERYELQNAATERLARRIAASLESALLSSPEWIGELHDTKLPESLGCLLRGIRYMNALTPKGTQAARAAFRRAARSDPGNPRAYACLAWCIKREAQLRGNVLSARDRVEGLTAARRAFELSPRDPFVLVHASGAAAFLDGDLRTGIELADLSLERDPNFVRTWAAAAEYNSIVGNTARAIEQAGIAVEIAPADPSLWVPRTALARACYGSGAFEEAAEHARSAAWRNPGSVPAHLLLAAAQAGGGEIAEARQTMITLRALAPDIDARSLPSRFALHGLAGLPRLVEHCRAAGLPMSSEPKRTQLGSGA